MAIIISATSSHIPSNVISKEFFLDRDFLNADGSSMSQTIEKTIKKFEDITGILERRYADKNQMASDIASIAAIKALDKAKINPEDLDGIIIAHNYGNIEYGTNQSDTVPSIATRVKYNLKIKNPDCIAFDLLFGCPGWIQGMITAKHYLLGENLKHFLVIGAETLSRVVDPFDRDSMIYADGAGATIITNQPEISNKGILSTAAQTFSSDEAYYLTFGASVKEGYTPNRRYIKMEGRKIYEFALNNVPKAMKHCLDKANVSIHEVSKIIIHQANEKMDEAILKRFYGLYNIQDIPKNVMPMTIQNLGNSSVATIPTLLDLILNGELSDHKIQENDIVLFASVGAGMNINAITYKF